MKKLISITLLLAMAVSMTACGCQHEWQDAGCTTPKTCILCGATEGEAAGHQQGLQTVADVDPAHLSMTCETPCAVCGEVLESTTSATGIAPVGSVIAVSADEWYDCLLTNVKNYGAGQSLYGYPVESQDSTLLHSIVTMSQMNAVFSFNDAEGNALKTDSKDARGIIHNIRMDAQFTNDNVKEFMMLLMLVMINNNSQLDPAGANTLCGQIMGGQQVSDNGYTYAMEITSVENHTVCVSITAE